MAVERHGGNRVTLGEALGCQSSALLDASASLVPWTPLYDTWSVETLRDYPDRQYQALRTAIATHHCLDAALVLPGNGAAELFTWAARDAAAAGSNVLPTPCFADYGRALRCWGATIIQRPMPLDWSAQFPQILPSPGNGDVLWICNPHNPTGQLWSRASLKVLLQKFALVICDEAFLPLVADGDSQSLIQLVPEYPNLVVIRSLTKLFGIAGVRLGYAVSQPERLRRWAEWRDPWPVNGIASAMGVKLITDRRRHRSWCHKVQQWTAQEGAWLLRHLAELPGIRPMPSAANFLLIRAKQSLVPLREALEQRHRILLRDCRSFDGLGECWLRIGFQSPLGNRRITRALQQELKQLPLV
ncbi:aminotransferase class I/II-fold pyridoxal phosphate-dependent enzyme [Synechococcus sp. M16CYN]|uniref:pyridoxal phosphate-dependent aminotransferase n=1 Tax=Synechococcus sp. M16CYN TaxID=3103139 RepID=UPI00324DCB81